MPVFTECELWQHLDLTKTSRSQHIQTLHLSYSLNRTVSRSWYLGGPPRFASWMDDTR